LDFRHCVGKGKISAANGGMEGGGKYRGEKWLSNVKLLLLENKQID
jgi:hypothetical protein